MNDNIENNYKRCELCEKLLHINEMTPFYTMNGSQIWLCNECILNGDVDDIVRILRNEQ